MLTNINLKARVAGSDGEDLGNVKYLVTSPANKWITHFVVATEADEDAREIVVEADRVGVISEDGTVVQLNLTREELLQLPDFYERQYMSSGQETTTTGDLPIQAEASGLIFPLDNGDNDPVTNSPGAAEGAPVIPGFFNTVGPVGAPFVETMNVPENSMIIKAGAEVMATDDRLGFVTEAQIDSNTGSLAGLTVENGLLVVEEISVPAEVVESASEEAISLSISTADVLDETDAEAEAVPPDVRDSHIGLNPM